MRCWRIVATTGYLRGGGSIVKHLVCCLCAFACGWVITCDASHVLSGGTLHVQGDAIRATAWRASAMSLGAELQCGVVYVFTKFKVRPGSCLCAYGGGGRGGHPLPHSWRTHGLVHGCRMGYACAGCWYTTRATKLSVHEDKACTILAYSFWLHAVSFQVSESRVWEGGPRRDEVDCPYELDFPIR